MDLLFSELSGANAARQIDYPTCNDWRPSGWMNALFGEVGELANLVKKYERDELPKGIVVSASVYYERMRQEIADAQTYLDIVASQLGINLARATIDTFNAKSIEIGSAVRISATGWYRVKP